MVVTNENEMVNRATCLMDFNHYFTGIYFLDINNNSAQFPPMIRYKIRHHPDFVDCIYLRINMSQAFLLHIIIFMFI